jgi:ADP-ribose pyrophosphatase YjhB (NUDIX family)
MFQRGHFKFCVNCGAALAQYSIPPGDNRERAACKSCGHIEYENPRNVVGTIPMFGDKVLLCKRAIEPRYGKWTLPAGFMELGETTAEGALRETIEEAGVDPNQLTMHELYAVMNVTRVGQVHLFYRATLHEAKWNPGDETLEAALFAEQDIPWEDLAFRTVSAALRCYFEDRKRGSFVLHTQDIA